MIGDDSIGPRMAAVCHAPSAKATAIELTDQIIPDADRNIVTPLMKRIGKRYATMDLETKVTG